MSQSPPAKKRVLSPAEITKSEKQEQMEVASYVRAKYPSVIMTTTGAGLGFNARFQKSMNQMGYAKGTPDLVFFEARHGFHGLLIEMKTVRGDIRPHQKEMREELEKRGYKACICFGSGQAIKVVDQYFAEN